MFGAWKALLLCIALTSPGPGYDTSTSLLNADTGLDRTLDQSHIRFASLLPKLVRWDAVYFTRIAQRGYSYEQEWAFGWGFTRVLAFLSKGLKLIDSRTLLDNAAIGGILLAHVSHLLSVFVLYELTNIAFSTLPNAKRLNVSFLAASLHIISPAGMFLSAPYAESPFSLLNFAGLYCYARSLESHNQGGATKRDFTLVLSGILFGVATTFRGNGLLSGLIFVYDAFETSILILHSVNLTENSRRMCIIIFTGILMACISSTPQFLAYQDFCSLGKDDTARRSWCSKWVPSIYGWVQSHYWGTGFLKYWTMSNLPLFLLATPMLYILLRSGFWACMRSMKAPGLGHQDNKICVDTQSQQGNGFRSNRSLDGELSRRFAMPQIILAILALTTYHVQIITRISSGYPVWYWWLASLLSENRQVQLFRRKFDPATWIMRWMVIYAIVQGGLFANFLPPA